MAVISSKPITVIPQPLVVIVLELVVTIIPESMIVIILEPRQPVQQLQFYIPEAIYQRYIII